MHTFFHFHCPKKHLYVLNLCYCVCLFSELNKRKKMIHFIFVLYEISRGKKNSLRGFCWKGYSLHKYRWNGQTHTHTKQTANTFKFSGIIEKKIAIFSFKWTKVTLFYCKFLFNSLYSHSHTKSCLNFSLFSILIEFFLLIIHLRKNKRSFLS